MVSVQRFVGNAAAIDGFLRSELRSSKVVRHGVRLLRREDLADTEAWLRNTVTRGSKTRFTTRQPFLERHSPNAASCPQLGIRHDGPDPDLICESCPHRALCVKALECATHERTAAVVPEPALVLRGSESVRAEVGIGQLAKCMTADETADHVFLNGLPRVYAEGSPRHAG